MTTKWISIGMALALATVAHARAVYPHHPAWLVGRWATGHPGQPSECPTQFTVKYHRDGRYEFMDEGGRWQVNGNRLTETMTYNDGTGDSRNLHRPQTSRIVRLSGGSIRLIRLGGAEELLIRCPATR